MVAATGLTVAGEAETAEAGLAAARRLRPDAALVDVRLPDRDRRELGAELAALPCRPRVLLASSDAGADGVEGGRRDAGRLAFVAREELPDAPLRQLLTRD
jgi:DNA-binding NarL/FixJ family response regulator